MKSECGLFVVRGIINKSLLQSNIDMVRKLSWESLVFQLMYIFEENKCEYELNFKNKQNEIS